MSAYLIIVPAPEGILDDDHRPSRAFQAASCHYIKLGTIRGEHSPNEDGIMKISNRRGNTSMTSTYKKVCILNPLPLVCILARFIGLNTHNLPLLCLHLGYPLPLWMSLKSMTPLRKNRYDSLYVSTLAFGYICTTFVVHGDFFVLFIADIRKMTVFVAIIGPISRPDFEFTTLLPFAP